jgi:integrase
MEGCTRCRCRKALDIIAAVSRRADRDYLFGGNGKGFTSWSPAKGELDARLVGKVQPWRLHDLRRTVATCMADNGLQPHVIEAVLNHFSGHRSGVAGIYNRSSYANEMRIVLALWAEHVLSIVEERESKIVPMRGAG